MNQLQAFQAPRTSNFQEKNPIEEEVLDTNNQKNEIFSTQQQEQTQQDIQQQQFQIQETQDPNNTPSQQQDTTENQKLEGLDKYECEEQFDDQGNFLYYDAKWKNIPNEGKNIRFRIYRQINQIREEERIFIEYVMKFQQEFEEDSPNSEFPSNIVRIYEFFEENNYSYIVMEETKQSLQAEIKFFKTQLEAIQIGICKQIAEAIRFLHLNKKIHRSLKPSDFVYAGQVYKLKSFTFLRSNDLRATATKIVVNEYSAPELAFKNSRDEKSLDIWSLGMIFYEIIQGAPIIDQTIIQNIKEKKFNEFQLQSLIKNKLNELNAEAEMTKLIKSMLNWNASQRPDIHEVVSKLDKFLQSKVENQNIVNYSYLVNSLIPSPTQQDPNRRFYLIKLLGDGAEGGVFQAKVKFDSKYKDQEIALKIQTNIKDGEQKFINKLIADQNNNSANYLIKIYEQFTWNGKQILVMELGQKDLYKYIQDNPKLAKEQKEKVCFEIAQSIKYIHNNNLVHRDIKPENFLLINSNFKLIDFGLIKEKQQNLRQTIAIGTPLYQAPELAEGKDNYSFEVDIWSLGCIFYEIFAGQALFDSLNLQEVKIKIMNHKVNQTYIYQKIDDLEISNEWKSLIKQMIHPDKTKRLDIENAIKQIPLKQQPQPTNQKQQFQFGSFPPKFPIQFQIIKPPKRQEPIPDAIAKQFSETVTEALKKQSIIPNIETFKTWPNIQNKLNKFLSEIISDLNQEISNQDKISVFATQTQQVPSRNTTYNILQNQVNFPHQNQINFPHQNQPNPNFHQNFVMQTSQPAPTTATLQQAPTTATLQPVWNNPSNFPFNQQNQFQQPFNSNPQATQNRLKTPSQNNQGHNNNTPNFKK